MVETPEAELDEDRGKSCVVSVKGHLGNSQRQTEEERVQGWGLAPWSTNQ